MHTSYFKSPFWCQYKHWYQARTFYLKKNYITLIASVKKLNMYQTRCSDPILKHRGDVFWKSPDIAKTIIISCSKSSLQCLRGGLVIQQKCLQNICRMTLKLSLENPRRSKDNLQILFQITLLVSVVNWPAECCVATSALQTIMWRHRCEPKIAFGLIVKLDHLTKRYVTTCTLKNVKVTTSSCTYNRLQVNHRKWLACKALCDDFDVTKPHVASSLCTENRPRANHQLSL